jgi:cytochrome d ubiquinol oxidase subunit I
MSFQFGTNWPGFMEKVGNVAGPLLAYEVLTAFFLVDWPIQRIP